MKEQVIYSLLLVKDGTRVTAKIGIDGVTSIDKLYNRYIVNYQDGRKTDWYEVTTVSWADPNSEWVTRKGLAHV
jgi:hypothetical protein